MRDDAEALVASTVLVCIGVFLSTAPILAVGIIGIIALGLGMALFITLQIGHYRYERRHGIKRSRPGLFLVVLLDIGILAAACVAVVRNLAATHY